MYSFGTRPPRALESFGVTGLLGEECQVFYENLFNTKHLGRVSDLLCVKIKDAGLDELRVRATILLSVFEAFRTQVAAGSEAKPLDAPMVLELGIDQEKVAIGLSFVDSGSKVRESGLSERLAQGKPEGAFEAILLQMISQSDRLILRHQPDAKRFEVVSVLGLPGKITESAASSRFEIIKLSKAQTKTAPKAKGYTQLGDLNYTELLQEEGKGKNSQGESAAEILIKGTAAEKEKETRLKGDGDIGLNNEVIVVKGSGEDIGQDNHITIVKGSGGDVGDRAMLTVKGGDTQIYEKLREAEAKVTALEQKLEFFEKRAGEASGGTEENAEDKPKGVFGFFKKALGFGKKKKSSEADAVVAAEIQAVEKGKAVAAGGVSADEQSVDAGNPAEMVVQESPEDLLAKAQEGGFGETVDRMTKEAADIKKEITSPRARKWIDGLMGELVSEKAKLAELFKKMSTSFKQKEFAMKNKEFGFVEELRRRQDALNQKDSQVARLKEQIGEMTLTLERVRGGGKDGGDNSQFKHKFQMAQKMLMSVKQENTELKTKMEEFRGKWMAAQGQAQKAGSGGSEKEIGALRLNYDRTVRQVEELKSKNTQLSERLNEIRKNESVKGNVDDVRRKLDQSQEKLATVQKENGLLTSKFDDQTKQMEQIKADLARTQAELRVVQSRAAKAEAAKDKKVPPKAGGTPPKAA